MTQEAGNQPSKPELLPVEKMEKMSHAELFMAREKAKTPEEQKHISPYEHRAFAREYVKENPVVGAIGVAAAIPAYQAAKGTGLHGSRTGLNSEQVKQGYIGVAEGVAGAVEPWKRVWNDALDKGPLEAMRTAAEKKPWEEDWSKTSTGKYEPPKPASTGFDMDSYIGSLSKAESGGDPKAKASTSRAVGLYQFIPSTWMEKVNKYNLPYTLSDRTDPEKSTEVAKLLTQENIVRARNDLGREPSKTEVYMYHLLGSAGRFLNAPKDALATSYVGKAAAEANKAVFEGRTVGEVIDRFKKKFGEK